MAVLEDRVLLVDYKTNRNPPRHVKDVPLSHRAQLAIYREILKPLYPTKPIECLLIYTETGTVLDLPEDVMRASLADLETS